jgi:hypothetical protein
MNEPSEERSLEHSISLWLTKYYLTSRLPGIEIPELSKLTDVLALMDEHSEDWEQKFRNEAFQEGQRQGQQEGESAIILRLSEQRFGALDDAVRQRIQSADTDTLLVWGDRLLSGQRIDEVFEDTPPA